MEKFLPIRNNMEQLPEENLITKTREEAPKLLPAPHEPSLLRESILFTIAIIFLGIIFFPGTPKLDQGERGAALIANAALGQDPFEGIIIEAKAAYVLDAVTGKVLFEKNSEEVLPLASVTKVMTALTALSILPEYAVVKVTRDALAAEGDSGLLVDERWLLRDLLQFTLITSSNDGARAVAVATGSIVSEDPAPASARKAFIAFMNERAAALTLFNTRFVNETGLDESTNISGGYSTAHDIAHLFAYAVITYPFLFEGTGERELTIHSLNEIAHTATNTNTAVHTIPMLIGSKTGFTDLAGGNLAVAFDRGPGRPIVIVALGSSLQGRFDDVTRLADAALKYIVSNP